MKVKNTRPGKDRKLIPGPINIGPYVLQYDQEVEVKKDITEYPGYADMVKTGWVTVVS